MKKTILAALFSLFLVAAWTGSHAINVSGAALGAPKSAPNKAGYRNPLIVAGQRIAPKGAASRSAKASLSVSVRADGKRGAGEWATGPIRVYAEANDPQAAVVYSLNGTPPLRSKEVSLNNPGLYQVAWKACKGSDCSGPYVQLYKIAFMDAQPLVFRRDANTWRFNGKVVDVQSVSLFGFPAEVAKVQSRYFAAWVVQRMDRLQLASAPVKVGDWVNVSISGPHVSREKVDWSLCKSESDYCALGSLVDSGLASPDTIFPLSPSNELIHFNRVSPQWNKALFWNTDLAATDQGVDAANLVASDTANDADAELVGQIPDGEYNGNPGGWYRSPVVARMAVVGKASLFYQLDHQPSQIAMDGKVIVSGDGEHEIVWSLGEHTATQYIRVDTGLPVVRWNTHIYNESGGLWPADTLAILSGQVDLRGLVWDAFSGAQEVEVSFDGGQTWESQPVTGNEWLFQWNTALYPNGDYTLLARAMDAAGNWSDPVGWQVTVANP